MIQLLKMLHFYLLKCKICFKRVKFMSTPTCYNILFSKMQDALLEEQNSQLFLYAFSFLHVRLNFVYGPLHIREKERSAPNVFQLKRVPFYKNGRINDTQGRIYPSLSKGSPIGHFYGIASLFRLKHHLLNTTNQAGWSLWMRSINVIY